MAENILHYGAVRYRLQGTGSLKHQLISLDDVITSDLLPLTMAEATSKEPARLCNFLTQRARLKMYTTLLGERVQINRIVVFVKPTYTSYPMID